MFSRFPKRIHGTKKIKNSCSESQIVVCPVLFFGEMMEGLVKPRTYLGQGYHYGHVTSAVTQEHGLMLCNHHLEIANFGFANEVHSEDEACTKDLESWLMLSPFYTLSLPS